MYPFSMLLSEARVKISYLENQLTVQKKLRLTVFDNCLNSKLTWLKQRMRRSWNRASQAIGRRVNGVRMMFSKRPSDSWRCWWTEDRGDFFWRILNYWFTSQASQGISTMIGKQLSIKIQSVSIKHNTTLEKLSRENLCVHQVKIKVKRMISNKNMNLTTSPACFAIVFTSCGSFWPNILEITAAITPCRRYSLKRFVNVKIS